MSRNPAKLAGLEDRKGALASGYDADVVVFDPEQRYELAADMLLQRHKVCPYVGHTLQGRVVCTYLRGEKIFEKGKILKERRGRTILKTS